MTSSYQKAYRIYLEDTDAGGIVYHANHLKLYERCRRDWLREIGMTSYFYQTQSENRDSFLQTDTQFVVNRANVRYLKPILLDSLVMVTVNVEQIKSASLTLYQTISNEHQQLLSDAHLTLACVTTFINENRQTDVRPTRLPSAFLQLLKP